MKLIYEIKRLFLKILDENDSEKVLDYVIRDKDFFSEFEPQRNDYFYTAYF